LEFGILRIGESAKRLQYTVVAVVLRLRMPLAAFLAL
jgi:hypothetical protein